MNSFVTTAIVGTSQHSGEKPITGTPVDALATQLPADSFERSVLLTAGAWSVYRRAGYQAQTSSQVQPVAEAETQQTCSKEAAHIIDGILRGNAIDVLPEALHLLTRHQLILPYELVIQALNYGADHKVLRAALIPVLGERGRWLSQFNKKWQWVAQFLKDTSSELPADAETIWEEGTYQQRSEILFRLRASDPAKARTWLANVWKTEKADARHALLSALEVNISAEDESFLEGLLKDRAASVRQEASDLLARIPTSTFLGRMTTRVEALFVGTPKNHIQLIEPSEPDEHWGDDGLSTDLFKLKDQNKRQSTFRELVYHMVSLIPPMHWTELFASTPAKIIGAVKKDQQRTNLINAWSKAACLHKDAQWALELLKWCVQTNGINDHFQELASLLNQAMTEDLILQHAFENERHTDTILAIHASVWSDQFGNAILEKQKELLIASIKKKNYQYYYSIQSLDTIALKLPYACFQHAEILKDIQFEDSKNWYVDHLKQKIDEFFNTLDVRKRTMKEILP